MRPSLTAPPQRNNATRNTQGGYQSAGGAAATLRASSWSVGSLSADAARALLLAHQGFVGESDVMGWIIGAIGVVGGGATGEAATRLSAPPSFLSLVKPSSSAIPHHLLPSPPPLFNPPTAPQTEPVKREAAARLAPWAETAGAASRRSYKRWRALVARALASNLDVDPRRAAALADAGSLMVGTGALGLVGGVLLSLAVG